jgi:rhamnogalacturonyl hydrolase YesR
MQEQAAGSRTVINVVLKEYILAQDDVINLIRKVNDRWQTAHPEPGNAFWHVAAYHTGNMAAYEITGEERYRKYSETWAEKNEWKGAPSNDKARWKYHYGETGEHVLFGDWQTCFQTYIDLYNLHPDKRKIARAREVMEYQMSTPNNDYWWWADGLYMVMPVMTKLYKATGNGLYLQKLHEYFSYAKDLMYDAEAGLFYRDAKYIFPKHKTKDGMKDFWARGNGWVFAALAKVLQDLPANDAHRAEYIQVFRSMAKALKQSQQPEGHWTRSILDAQQAPGYETSGTAFFTFGFLWGINNGILDKTEYAGTVSAAWKYLTETALQPDGTVGYVQPIGERADQHIVNAATTADFGVGAFLLATAEMTRYLDTEKFVADRKYWADLAYQIAAPALGNMSKGELSKNMQLELSPTWDGRDKRVTYMEAFGRLMDGIAPWLALPDDNTDEGKQRKQLREWALKSYAHAVDPDSPDYLLWRSEGQPLVDAAFLASSFLRAPAQLWNPLDSLTKQRYIAEFQQLRRINPPYTNWLLFSATIETFLLSIDASPDMYRIHSAIRKIEEWYVGDSWYSDGEHFAFDYYNSYVIQPMYIQVLKILADKKRFAADKTLTVAHRRMQRYGAILERMISPEGSFPVFGRSMTYRLGVFQPLALLAWKEQLPEELPEGQVRAALTAVMKRMFSGEGNFNEKGYLQLGFAGHQPELADRYTNNGSLYLTSEVFLPLGLPANHSFWTSPAQDWTTKKAWSGMAFPKDHAIRE